MADSKVARPEQDGEFLFKFILVGDACKLIFLLTNDSSRGKILYSS